MHCHFSNERCMFILGRILNQICLLCTGWYKAEILAKSVFYTETCSQPLQGERKTTHYFSWAKLQMVQWFVSEVSEVTRATTRAKQLSAQQCHTSGVRRMRFQAVVTNTRQLRGSVWRCFRWHILSSTNQHLQMKHSSRHFKAAVVIGFLQIH